MALKPKSRRSARAEGDRHTMPVVPVEPVFEREGLRNYKENEPGGGMAQPGDSSADQDELRHLLESLKSSDVMSVKHKKGSTKPQVVQATYSKPYTDSDLDLSEGDESPGT